MATQRSDTVKLGMVHIYGYEQYLQIQTYEQIWTYAQIWTDIHNIHKYKHMNQYRHMNGYGQILVIFKNANISTDINISMDIARYLKIQTYEQIFTYEQILTDIHIYVRAPSRVHDCTDSGSLEECKCAMIETLWDYCPRQTRQYPSKICWNAQGKE